MTREDYERFERLTNEAEAHVEALSCEVEVEGQGWVEVTVFPALDGRWLEIDWSVVDQFPELSEALKGTLSAATQCDAETRAERRQLACDL